MENNITAIISLFDIDLYMLAKHKEEFAREGVTVIVSDPEVIEVCNDKWKTFLFCEKAGLKAPKTYCRLEDAEAAIDAGELDYPVMIKPRWGMGSIAVYQAENREELEVLAKKVKREIFQSYLKYESALDEEVCVLFQEKIKGQEYGLDVVHDLRGNHCLTVVRKKIAMRSGETDCAKVLEDEKIAAVGTAVGEALGHIGNLDMDVFVTEDDIYVLERNARFGGGYPFSHLAGVNLPKAVIMLRNAGLEINGIHLHTSTKSRSAKVFTMLARKAVELAKEYQLRLQYIDMGGGFFGGQKVEGKPSMEEYAAAICGELKNGFKPEETRLILEPGASVIATSMEYMTRVINTRDIRGERIVTLDGTVLHINPFMSHRTPVYRLVQMQESSRKEKQLICGCTCMENDRFLVTEDEKTVETGDFFLFQNAGAYTEAFNSEFILNQPKVYVV